MINGVFNQINQATGGILGGVGNLLYGIENNINNAIGYKNEQLLNEFRGIAGTIEQLVQGQIQPIVNALAPIWNSFDANFRAQIVGIASDVTTVGTSIIGAFERGLEIIQNNSAGFQFAIEDELAKQSGAINQNLYELGVVLNNAFMKQNDKVINAIQDTTTTVTDNINNFLTELDFTLKHLFDGVVDTVHQDVDKGIKWSNERIAYAFQQIAPRLELGQKIYDKILSGGYNDLASLRADLQLTKTDNDIINIIFGIISVVQVFVGLNDQINSAVSERIQQLVDSELKPKIIDLGTIISLYWKNPNFQDYYTGLLHQHGYNDEQIHNFLDDHFLVIPLEIVSNLFLRGVINESEHDNYLQRLGYDGNSTSLLKTSYIKPVTIPEIVEYSIKGLSDNSYIQYMGLNDRMYGDITGYAKANGVTDFSARLQHLSAWQFPSIPDCVDLFRRGLIDGTALNYVLQYSNIPPYFRDKLVAQSYEVLSRRDLKALHKLRIISDNDVFNGYKRLGYNDNDARNLTNYTIRFDDDTTNDGLKKLHDLSEGALKSAYERDIITSGYARQKLIDIGYKPDDTTLIIQLWDYDKSKQKNTNVEKSHHDKAVVTVLDGYTRGVLDYDQTLHYLVNLGFTSANASNELSYLSYDMVVKSKLDILTHVKTAYIADAIDIAQATAILANYSFSQNEISNALGIADLYKSLKHKSYTEAEVKHFFKLGVLTQDDYLTELKGMGYSDKYIGWIQAELALGA